MNNTNTSLAVLLAKNDKAERKRTKTRKTYSRTYKETIQKHLSEGILTYEQIAALVGCSIDAVKYYKRAKPKGDLLERKLKKYKISKQEFLSYQKKNDKGEYLCFISGEKIDMTNNKWAVGISKSLGVLVIYLKKYSLLFNMDSDKLIQISKHILKQSGYEIIAPKNFFDLIAEKA
jgi:hypothetical protein